MKRKTKNIHKFIIPKSAGGHYEIKTKKVKKKTFEYYKVVPSQNLSRTIGRIYDLNIDKIRDADPDISKENFKNKVVAIMKEGKRIVSEKTGEVKYIDRTLNEALRIVSRSTTFTSKYELGLENIKKNIFRKGNAELRAMISLEWGEPYTHKYIDKDGVITFRTINRIPWSKIVWDEKTQSYRLKGADGKLSQSGMKFLKRKKGKYAIDEVFEFVSVV